MLIMLSVLWVSSGALITHVATLEAGCESLQPVPCYVILHVFLTIYSSGTSVGIILPAVLHFFPYCLSVPQFCINHSYEPRAHLVQRECPPTGPLVTITSFKAYQLSHSKLLFGQYKSRHRPNDAT